MDRTFLEQVNINTKGERRMEQGNRHVDIIRSIGIWMSETRELRKKIVVQSTGKYNWDDILADFCSKEEILDKIFSNSFYFRKTQGYYASFLVQGLRVKDEEGFKYFLFYIFLREIVSVGMIKGSLILEKMVNKVGEYIHDTWGVDCEGRIFIDSGIPGSTILTELIDDLPRGADDLEDIVRKLCKICLIYWKAFFYDYGLAVYNAQRGQVPMGAHFVITAGTGSNGRSLCYDTVNLGDLMVLYAEGVGLTNDKKVRMSIHHRRSDYCILPRR